MTSTATPPTLADQTCRLAIVWGEAPVSQSLLRTLTGAGIELDSQARDADELAAVAERLDVVIIWGHGERSDRFNDVRAARDAIPHPTALIAVWPASSTSDARAGLRAGADGFVAEHDLETTLIPTIRAVRSGLICIPRPMRAPLESEPLSMREKQVLAMLVMGFTNAQIAGKLFLAESTVKSHLSSAYTKLGVRSRSDAATLILDPVEGFGPGILALSAA